MAFREDPGGGGSVAAEELLKLDSTDAEGARWAHEIEGRKQRLHAQADKLAGIVSAAIASEPERITASEARAQQHAYYDC